MLLAAYTFPTQKPAIRKMSGFFRCGPGMIPSLSDGLGFKWEIWQSVFKPDLGTYHAEVTMTVTGSKLFTSFRASISILVPPRPSCLGIAILFPEPFLPAALKTLGQCQRPPNFSLPVVYFLTIRVDHGDIHCKTTPIP